MTTDQHPGDLTEIEVAVLDLERERWKYMGAKAQRILDDFGWSTARYYQVLNALLERPEALAYDPVTVRRLIRLREQRQRGRAARRLGFAL